LQLRPIRDLPGGLFMYVCLCRGFTDRQVRSVCDQGAGSVASVYASLGGPPRCGKCVPTVRDLMREGASGVNAGEAATTG
jgi:bacterioferritin-associated ferredoxin